MVIKFDVAVKLEFITVKDPPAVVFFLSCSVTSEVKLKISEFRIFVSMFKLCVVKGFVFILLLCV